MGDYLINIGMVSLINALLVLGLTVVTPFAGRISVASAAIAGVGAYTFAIATTTYQFHPVLGCALGVFAGGLVGGGVSFIVARLKGEIHLLGTLALQLVIVETFRRWRDLTGGDAGIHSIPSLLPGMNTAGLLAVAVTATILVAAGLHIWLRGASGLRYRAIREDRDVAAAAGCHTTRELLIAFVVSGCITGFGGTLFAMHLSYLQPTSFGLDWSLTILLMAMLAGANLVGAVAAAIGLTVLPELIYFTVEIPGIQVNALQNTVYGLVLLALMLAKPGGLFPELRSAPPRSRSGAAG